MAIDRIIAGIVLILGGIHITLLYALAEQPPLNEPKPELWVAIVLGIIFILEAATTLRRCSQPITMLWICIALEAMRYVVLIVSEQAANSSSICIAALAYAAIRYTPAPYKQLAAQSAIYTITSAIAYIYMPMPMPMEGISAPLLLGTIGAATGLAMLVIGIIPGYIALSNNRLAEAKRQTLLANERTRIARELHDTTAHHLSSIAIQTTAARAVLHTNPHAAEQQLEGISTSISKALADVRATVNHLRTPTEAETNRTPQPTLATIPDLITECQQLGMNIHVTGPGLRTNLTAPEQQCAYRTIQEALTNARKHAPGAPVTIHMDNHGLAIQTHGHFQPSTPGRGSIGMQERADNCGATLTNQPNTQGWEVTLTWT